eukprot:6672801-Prymnesium_polylepis.2
MCTLAAVRLSQVEEDCRVRQAILMEKQEIARVDREKEVVEHVSKIRFKKSSTLLQLEDTEKKLAKQHDFKQARGSPHSSPPGSVETPHTSRAPSKHLTPPGLRQNTSHLPGSVKQPHTFRAERLASVA